MNNPSVTSSEVLLISEATELPESWEPLRYRFKDLKFPFFTSEPLLAVIEGHPTHFERAKSLFQEISRLGLQTQVILIDIQLSVSQLIELGNIKKPFSILSYDRLEEIQTHLTEALNQARKGKQDQVLLELFNEQNIELKKISNELENKINIRQKDLEEAKSKLSETRRRALLLQECLIAIHNSMSISDLEVGLTNILQKELDLIWLKVSFFDQQLENISKSKMQDTSYVVPLSRGNEDYGQLLFSKDVGFKFNRNEKRLLDQVAEGVSLCLGRIFQVERNSELLSQWQATFDAISDHVCLIDTEYNVHVSNRQEKNANSIQMQKCYQLLFNRKDPCVGCHRGEDFRLKNESKTSQVFDVQSQSVQVDHKSYYFHLYRDVSRQLGFERQILESAKLAELGTIGSSIAHELNNPLGGMINFLQLIRMDLSGDEDYVDEIEEMEKGAIKCKEIIQNLLGFSRHANLSQLRKISMQEIVQQSILITELKTRALGIRIHTDLPGEDIFVNGRFNQLAQALCNVLQNAFESILEVREKEFGFNGEIRIHLYCDKKFVHIAITDNGGGIKGEVKDQIFDPLFTTKDLEKNSGLGLTLARQIVLDHGGTLTVSPQKKDETCFVLSLQTQS